MNKQFVKKATYIVFAVFFLLIAMLIISRDVVVLTQTDKVVERQINSLPDSIDKNDEQLKGSFRKANIGMAYYSIGLGIYLLLISFLLYKQNKLSFLLIFCLIGYLVWLKIATDNHKKENKRSYGLNTSMEKPASFVEIEKMLEEKE